MDPELEVAVEVATELNETAVTLSGSTMFYVQHIPGHYTCIKKGNMTCWDTLDNRADGCDGSKESIIAYIISVLDEDVFAMTSIIEVYQEEVDEHNGD
jgi:hypothetical protein